MNSVFILLNSLNDWKPYCETDSLMTVTDYLEHRYGERTPKLVINLSDEYGYNSEGYYCSLLAQARGHRVLPGVETLNKLESGAGIRMNRNLQQLCQQWIERNRITDETWQLNIYFGTCREKGLEKIARFIFDHYPCPILRVTMNNHARNQIESVQALSLRQLSRRAGRTISPMRSTASTRRYGARRARPSPHATTSPSSTTRTKNSRPATRTPSTSSSKWPGK